MIDCQAVAIMGPVTREPYGRGCNGMFVAQFSNFVWEKTLQTKLMSTRPSRVMNERVEFRTAGLRCLCLLCLPMLYRRLLLT